MIRRSKSRTTLTKDAGRRTSSTAAAQLNIFDPGRYFFDSWRLRRRVHQPKAPSFRAPPLRVGDFDRRKIEDALYGV